MDNKKSKLTLIVDGNWLLMSRWSVLKERYADDEEMCREIQMMMVKSINVVLRTFPSIDNIIFVADGGSWRNELPIPEFLGEEYKGNREPDPTVNWKMIFEYFEEFISILSNNGVTTCKVPGVEGDDWCWYWSNKLNTEGVNCVIWSMDKDLTQLVRTNQQNGVFTICWNKNGMTCEEGDYSEGTDLDFFFGDLNKENNQHYLHEFVSKSAKVNQINPKTVVIDKIIRGDKGDNIFPIILRTSKPDKEGNVSDKMFRVSTKDLNFDLDIHNQTDIRNYVSTLLQNKTYVGRVKKSESDIINHFNYNVKLVALEKESYPETILESMNSYVGYSVTKDISNVNSYITARSNKISNILDII